MLSTLLLGGEVHSTPAAERSRKADLAPDARNEPESRVLRALRKSPAATVRSLSETAGLSEEVTRATVRALEDRLLVRYAVSNLGASRIEAVSPTEAFKFKFR